MLGNLADPLLYMLALGFGLGALLPEVAGHRYIVFLAGGTVCYSTMNSATFEALYSGFSRMHVQRTWDAILNAPLSLDDVVTGEWVWAASKSFLSGLAILVAIWVLGLSHEPMTLWIIAVAWLLGLCFAGLGLAVIALAPSYDFFMYYFTLFITPMTLLCGVFFPLSQLPPLLQAIAQALPLTHAIELVRPLLSGEMSPRAGTNILVLIAYALGGFYLALVLLRKRLLK